MGGIELITKHAALAFDQALQTPVVQLDGGAESTRPWGKSFMPAFPGIHTVRCYLTSLGSRRASDSTTRVEVVPGMVACLEWKPSAMSWQFPGHWQDLGHRPLSPSDGAAPPMRAQPATQPAMPPAPPANWYPDPSARHQLRYFDGAQWTPYVADAGVTSIDPL